MEIELEPRRISLLLSAMVTFLTLANLTGQGSIPHFKQDSLYGRAPLFHLDYERSVPTFYSAITLFTCSALLAIIAKAGCAHTTSFPWRWMGLSLIFLFLSFDEMLSLHERLIGPLRSALHTSGLLYFAWVIPYGILLIIFLGLFWTFLKRLPAHTQRLFVLLASICWRTQMSSTRPTARIATGGVDETTLGICGAGGIRHIHTWGHADSGLCRRTVVFP